MPLNVNVPEHRNIARPWSEVGGGGAGIRLGSQHDHSRLGHEELPASHGPQSRRRRRKRRRRNGNSGSMEEINGIDG